jgi:hypothetical protein
MHAKQCVRQATPDNTQGPPLAGHCQWSLPAVRALELGGCCVMHDLLCRSGAHSRCDGHMHACTVVQGAVTQQTVSPCCCPPPLAQLETQSLSVQTGPLPLTPPLDSLACRPTLLAALMAFVFGPPPPPPLPPLSPPSALSTTPATRLKAPQGR